MNDIFYMTSTYVFIFVLAIILWLIAWYLFNKDSNFLGILISSITIIVLVLTVIFGCKMLKDDRFYERNGTKLTGVITQKEMDEDGFFSIKVEADDGGLYHLNVEEETFHKIKKGEVQTLYRHHNNAIVSE